MSTDEAVVQEESGMVRTSVHLEVELHEALSDLADEADRSFAAEVRRRLRQSIELEQEARSA